MNPKNCLMGDGRINIFRGFCSLCKVKMGLGARMMLAKESPDNILTIGQRKVIRGLEEHNSSIKAFGGGKVR